MAEQNPTEGASSSGASVSESDSTMELNIKTLNSQIYKFHVDKNMRVSLFKEKIADQIGIPVGQQRLIFRGKVLKDEHLLSEYHVENGDTLHLVERQPTQPQSLSGSGFADSSVNSAGAQGNDGGAGAPSNRIGQISHSVVLGTLNVGDQGEVVSDFSRVIGAVLNSLGVGNLNATNATAAAQNAAAAQNNAADAASQNSSGPEGNAEQGQGRSEGQSQAGNQAQFGQPFFSQPFHIPVAGASVPAPLPNLPIPDSLNTLSEFMTRMEGVLSQNGYQSNSSPTGIANQSATTELPANVRGFPTPEALSRVLRQAQRLLSGSAVAALSHIAGRLEQEAGSTDNSVRNQIQTESVQVGLAMQHLGALFLELGRTILMLRMGQSPAEGVVNAGPAVYISPSGPNPIMVQPFPHQPSPLFNSPAASVPNTGTSGPVGIIGSAPRHINIHIHAGTSAGTRVAGGEAAQGEGNNGTGSSGSGSARVLPVRNVIAAAVPCTATIAVSPVPNVSRPVGGVSASQPHETASLSSTISQVNSQIRNFVANMQANNLTPSSQQDNLTVPNSSFASSGGTADAVEGSTIMHSEISRGATDLSIGSMPELQAQEDQNVRKENAATDSVKPNDEFKCLVEPSPSRQSGGFAENSECSLQDTRKSGDSNDKSAGTRDVPLGLGGGLQPKRRSRVADMQLKSGEGDTSANPDQSQQTITSGQQFLQSLASRSAPSRMVSNDTAPTQIGQEYRQTLGSTQGGTHGTDGQRDVTGMMSQLLDSSALNGLLSGVAQQTGVGSPDVLRNMLQQFMQNPAMRNTVNQLAQQVDREEFRDMFAGAGTGPDGSLDISSMFQQMMPVVSQVLGGGSGLSQQVRSMMPELPPQFGDRRLSGGDGSLGQSSQNDIHEVVQRIANQNPPQDVFRGVVQSAAESSGIAVGELVDGLCRNEDLANQFVEILRRDLHRQLQGGSASGGSS